MADNKKAPLEDLHVPIATQQVGPGSSGTAIIEIRIGANTVGYVLTIGAALTAPNGDEWPVPGQTIDYTEFWYMPKALLQDIHANRVTGLTLVSNNLVPANSNPSNPTVASDPLTVLPGMVNSPVAQWTTGQAPTFSQATKPVSASSTLELYGNGSGNVSLGFRFSGSGSSLALVNLFWATTTTGNPPSFWFGTNPDAGSGTTQVNGSFSTISSYPSASGSYLRKYMTLNPVQVPLG